MFKLGRILSGIRFMMLVFVITSLLYQNGFADYVNPAVGDETDAAYWLDRGGLYATYGNFPVAVEAYKKAMSIDQHNSVVYFNLSLAYSEMGAFDEALISVKKALAKEPQNDQYHYGLAWILLKANRIVEAQDQFQKAANLGNQDALVYLQTQH